MRIVITTTSPSIDSEVDQRFGRSAFFLEIDPETLEWNAHPNPALEAAGSAGVQAAKFLADRKVGAVISGNFGPNAFTALDAAGVSMYRYAQPGLVRSALDEFKAGRLERLGAPSRAQGLHSGRGRL